MVMPRQCAEKERELEDGEAGRRGSGRRRTISDVFSARAKGKSVEEVYIIC